MEWRLLISLVVTAAGVGGAFAVFKFKTKKNADDIVKHTDDLARLKDNIVYRDVCNERHKVLDEVRDDVKKLLTAVAKINGDS